MMSYTDTNTFFANTAFNITTFNNTSNNVPTQQAGQGRTYGGDTIITQNSFTYLQTVLGTRPSDATGPGGSRFHVANSPTIDPSARPQLFPGRQTLAPGATVQGFLDLLGEYD